MKVRPLIPGLCALVLCFGCEDDTTTSDTSRPSLRVGGGGECGATLPVPTQAEFAMRTYRTAAVTVSGTDPGASSMEIRNGTEVTLVQSSSNPDTPQVVAFVSGFDAALAGGVAGPVALQQAAESDAVTFVGGGAVDRVFCISGGTAIIEASIPSYAGGGGFVGPVTTPQNQRFQIRCVSPEVYEQQCGNPVPPDAAPPSEDAGSDAGATDGGVDAEATDGAMAPSLWTIKFIPPEDPTNLQVGIRNSGLGQRDNTELVFQVAELDRPLGNVLVTFFLDDITQPGVTISGGNASLFEEDDRVVVRTSADGFARVRLIAGGNPGLAAVRAVALRNDANDLMGCAEDDFDCQFDAYCGNNFSRVEPARECEQDRSQVVTIAAGVPSARNLHLTCLPEVVPAFENRELLRNEPENIVWEGLANDDGPACLAQVADRVNGRVQAGVGMFFLTEAGTMDEIQRSDDAGRAISQMRLGLETPTDVPSNDYEIEAGFPEEGFNPRDGLVRVIVFTRGEEAFVDANGDNIYREADGDFQLPSQDLPEPFVDENDNGTWDDGEPFQDSNDDGGWTDANGVWDGSTDIWTASTVLWVGHLFDCSPATESPYACADPETVTVQGEGGVSFACGNNCSNMPFNLGCAGAGLFVDPITGGTITGRLRANDSNGNCVKGEFTVDPGGTSASGAITGRIDCDFSTEQPVVGVIDLGFFVPPAPPVEMGPIPPTDFIIKVSIKYEGTYQSQFEKIVTLRVCR